jgi:hypothetical protein
MKVKTLIILFFLGISLSIMAQKSLSDFVTKGNENFSIINISRSYTYQEVRSGGKLPEMVYINDQPICDIVCPSRVSLKIFSEGKLNLVVKYLPYKTITQKDIDKHFRSGIPLEIDVTHGKTYFVNVDTKVREGFAKVSYTVSLVAIPESESMYRDEERFIKIPEIKEFQEDIKNPVIKK